MRLLVDTDVYCKLSVSNLFLDAIHLRGADSNTCGRLAALPHMLAKGRLKRTYGSTQCDKLIPVVLSMPTVICTNDSLIDTLVAIPSIFYGIATAVTPFLALSCTLTFSAISCVSKYSHTLSQTILRGFPRTPRAAEIS